MNRSSASAPKRASTTPSNAPAPESRSDSVRTWRASRMRPAPSETRTAISRRRAAPRASSMLATLVHAINCSSPTTAIRMRSGAENRSRKAERPPAADSRSIVVCSQRRLPLFCAIASTRGRFSTFSSARACATETPGFIRAINPRFIGLVTGSHTSGNTPGSSPVNARGATPTIAAGAPLTVSGVPRTARFAPNRFDQYDQLMTTTGAAPGSVSCGASRRPSTGWRPSVSKRFPATNWPSTVSGSAPSRVTFTDAGAMPVTAANTWL